MRLSVRVAACMLVFASSLLTLSGCGVPDEADARCGSDACTLHVHAGMSLKVAGQNLVVQDVDDGTVTLSSHGVRFKLSKKIDLTFGKHQFHLIASKGSGADIEVD